MRICILQNKEENTNVESTMVKVDKDVEKRTQYNRIRRKTLMISVTTPTHRQTGKRRKRDEMTIVKIQMSIGR